MPDATVNFGDGSPSGDATFGTAIPHTYAAGTFGISAMTPDGKRGNTSAVGPGDFDITVTDVPVQGADPNLISLTPATGTVGQAVNVQAVGDHFVSGSTVEADGAALPTVFVDATHLTADITPSTAKTVQFTVRNPDDMESNSVAWVVS